MKARSGIVDPEDILLLASDAARLMLESGGETYRAEETAEAISSGLGGVETECFAIPTGIVLSFAGPDGRIRSIVRRVKKRSMNLEKVARLDAMARDLQGGRLDYAGAAASLEATERLAERPLWVQLLAAAATAGFFTLLFGGSWNEGLVAALLGAILSRGVKWLTHLRLPDFLINLAGGAVVTLASLAVNRMGLIDRVDLTVIGTIMLLVPGVAITNAIRDTIAGDLVAGLARGADAFTAAAAISAGAGGATALWRLLTGGRA